MHCSRARRIGGESLLISGESGGICGESGGIGEESGGIGRESGDISGESGTEYIEYIDVHSGKAISALFRAAVRQALRNKNGQIFHEILTLYSTKLDMC